MKNMKIDKKLTIFILTYGRPDKIYTLDTLKKQNYTGKIYLLCSSDDKSLKEYKKKYNNVIVFNKKDYKNTFDIGDNFKDERVVVYARNAVFDIAKKLNIEFFLVLDDDYVSIKYTTNGKGTYTSRPKIIKNLDNIISKLLKYYEKTNAKTLCIAQDGDFIGGKTSRHFKLKLTRKAMNFFICSTKRPFKFIGRINEDVNTYVLNGNRGDVFLTIANLRLSQKATQQNTGGLTEFYLQEGTYIKSFYTVIFSPSCVVVAPMGKHKRLHHRINWNNAVPKILNEQYKKF